MRLLVSAVGAIGLVAFAAGTPLVSRGDGAQPEPLPRVGRVDADVAVPMRDGAVLRADVVRPPADVRHPTLVYRTPYDKRATTSGALVRAAVERGYAVVVQDVRGRYASDGAFRPYQQEGADGYDTIEWAAAQPWSNGRVGTFGASYPGAVQWLAAVQSPPHLVAMVPAMTFASPAHFWYTGGVWDHSWLMWTWLNIAPDLRLRAKRPGPQTYEAALASWPTEGIAARDHLPLAGMPAFKGLADWYYEWMAHPPYDPWWNWAELTDKYDRVSAAVLNVSGWHDEMYGPLGATTNFAGLVRARGGVAREARTQVVIGPWTHGSDWDETKVGEREMGPAAALDYDALVLDWMDRWVKGEVNGVDRQAPVRLFMMGANEWRTAEAWPPPADPKVFYLDGTPVAGRVVGRLSDAPPTRGGSVSFVSDAAKPVRDVHDGEAGAFDYGRLAFQADVVAFDSPRFDAGVEVAGPIEAEIFVSVDRPDTDLWVKVLGREGDRYYNVMSTGLEVIRASYRNRRPRREPLEPGRVYRLDLRTMLTANRFTDGIRVALMASFAPNMSRNLHTGDLEFDSAATERARVTVHFGGEYPSRIVLPVAARGNATAPGPSASSR